MDGTNIVNGWRLRFRFIPNAFRPFTNQQGRYQGALLAGLIGAPADA